MIFRNDNHGVLFEKEIRYHKGCSRKMTAALYLLTADSRLWRQAEDHVGTHDIDINAMKPRRLDSMAYVCYALARDIITGSQSVALTELADPNLFGPQDHLRLAETLFGSKALWLLSYNDCETIRALYSVPGVYIEKIERINNLAQRYDPGNMYQELLISNYDTSLVLLDQISLSGFAPEERNFIWK